MANSKPPIQIRYLWMGVSHLRLIANRRKHQAIMLGNTEHQFNFLVNDSLHLFGVTVDKHFILKQHVSSTCKKVNNQFSVVTTFGKLMSTETIKNYVLPTLQQLFCKRLKINILCMRKPSTILYGINSLRTLLPSNGYLAAKSWNAFLDHYRTFVDFNSTDI